MSQPKSIFGPLLLIAAGAIWLLTKSGNIPTANLWALTYIWPYVLIAAGVGIILRSYWQYASILLDIVIIGGAVLSIVTRSSWAFSSAVSRASSCFPASSSCSRSARACSDSWRRSRCRAMSASCSTKASCAFLSSRSRFRICPFRERRSRSALFFCARISSFASRMAPRFVFSASRWAARCISSARFLAVSRLRAPSRLFRNQPTPAPATSAKTPSSTSTQVLPFIPLLRTLPSPDRGPVIIAPGSGLPGPEGRREGPFPEAQGFRGHLDPAYYDDKGQSVAREFLKTPLRYSRISSGFSKKRLHPVLRIYRPHLGVDYAAPSGTPVEATANGKIIFMG